MENNSIDEFWDDNPIDVSTEVNFIWSIANKLRGPYQSDKYKDVIIPMVIIRRFECALQETKDDVVAQYKKMPTYPAKAVLRKHFSRIVIPSGAEGSFSQERR